VLAAGVCGYSVHIERAEAGIITTEPFAQAELDRALRKMLQADDDRCRWRENALAYVAENDLFSVAEKAAARILEVAAARGQQESRG
jgi:hypothetical protein